MTVTLRRPLSREDLRAIVEASEWPCECPELICLEVPGAVCASCKARKWINEGVEISEELS